MKKILAIILTVLIAASVILTFTFKNNQRVDNDKSKTEVTAIGRVEEITVDTAKIKGSDAIALIKSYSDDELGLSEDIRKQCDFMVKGQGVRLNGDYYIEVIATVKSSKKNSDGKEVYSFDNKGVYYIRYDGKEVLKKDMKSGETSKLKVKEVPSTTIANHETTKAK
ncbi:MAG: hypothetical protein IJT65_01260 [Eubacterium sp.]|nr:hypothetical protein [Eubacterium sp.]